MLLIARRGPWQNRLRSAALILPLALLVILLASHSETLQPVRAASQQQVTLADPDRACATCHAAIYNSYEQTNMARGSGLAPRLLAAVEERAARVTSRLVLHTGERQRAAIALYEGSGYRPIPIFPPYDRVPESRCYAKEW